MNETNSAVEKPGCNDWTWILVLANTAIVLLLIFGIRAILRLFGTFASSVSVGPVAALIPIGWVLSLTGVIAANKAGSGKLRVLGLVVSGLTLIFHSALLVGLATIFVFTPTERFLIPDGYIGDVYVVHNIADGEANNRTSSGISYRVPSNGVLLTRGPVYRGAISPKYYYERGDSTLKRIRTYWPSTIARTAENLADDKSYGVYFLRVGSLSILQSPGIPDDNVPQCPVEYEMFYVGTKANLLAGNHQKDLSSYLKGHSVVCGDRKH